MAVAVVRAGAMIVTGLDVGEHVIWKSARLCESVVHVQFIRRVKPVVSLSRLIMIYINVSKLAATPGPLAPRRRATHGIKPPNR